MGLSLLKVSYCVFPGCNKEIRTGATLCSFHSKEYHEEKRAKRSNGKSPAQIIEAAFERLMAKNRGGCSRHGT